MLNNLEKATKQLQTGALFVNQTEGGIFKITGKNRLDLIDRMSTQAVGKLKAGMGAATVLTTDIGRIIDRIFLYQEENHAFMICSKGNNAALSPYLSRYVFFNDDFHLMDQTETTAIWAIYGKESSTAVASLFESPDLIDLPLHHWRTFEKEGHTVSIHRTDPLSIGHGYWIVAPKTSQETVTNWLMTAQLLPVEEPIFDSLRIQAGLPMFGHELTSAYIPLESNLINDISFNKGCYLGQEIIARMDSRGKLAKRLIRVHIPESVPTGAEIRTVKGQKAGTITSIAPALDGFIGLAYIKTAILADSSPLQINDISCSVAELP